MSTKFSAAANGAKFRRSLDREAVDLALKGEWERAAQVNRAILELFADDVEAMNRLAKALIELGSYEEAGSVLDHLNTVAPYNNIARKNRARLEQMRSQVKTNDGAVASSRHARKATGAPQLFIGESGKSATTLLRQAPRRITPALVSPGDPVSLRLEHHALNVYADDGKCLGQVDPRLGHRLSRLIEGGNTYEAAVIGVNDEGISVIIHETHRDRSLQHVASFPTRAAPLTEPRIERYDDPADRLTADDEDADEEEEEGVINEEELQAAWSENE